MSHLLQMRGLKHLPGLSPGCQNVASFTDAWIETRTSTTIECTYHVASFTDAWIETPIENAAVEMVDRRIFYRCVD